MKKILILGGGKNQLPLLEAAKEEGYFIILCDYDPNALGRKLCDKFYEVSIIDENKILKIASDENINGIVANTEAVMTIVDSISEKLDLVGNSECSISTLASKSKFREFQSNIGLYAPKHYESDVFYRVIDELEKFKFPIIIKPSQSSGSRGVTVIDSRENEDSIRQAFETCKKYSRNNCVVFEEYVDMKTMDEVEAEIFIHNGEILWDGLLLTLRNEKKPLIPMTDIYPLPYSENRINIIKHDLQRIVDELGIRHGEYNAELYFTPDDQLFVMEINARQGGDSIPAYVHKSCGVDMYKLMVTTAVGEEYYWDYLKTYVRQISYITHHPLFSYEEGQYRGLLIDKNIEKYITKIEMKIQLNDNVYEAKDASDEIGYVDLMFPNSIIQEEVSMHLDDYIKVETI